MPFIAYQVFWEGDNMENENEIIRMKKKFIICALIIMVIVLIIGVTLILNSVGVGENAGNEAIQRHGGSMDTAAYERIIADTTTNFRTIGAILSLIGGFGVLLSGYGVYKEL